MTVTRNNLAELKSQASEMVKIGDLGSALELYTKAYQFDKRDIQSICGLAAVNGLLGRSAEHQRLAKKAVKIKPGDAYAQFTLGSALLTRGKFREAEVALKRAVRLAPKFPAAYNNLGNALSAQNQKTDAEAAYLQALEVAPGYAEAKNNLGCLYIEMKRVSDAEQLFSDVVSQNPLQAEACNNLASAKFSSGRALESLQHYRAAIKANPNYTVAHSYLLFALSAIASCPPVDMMKELHLWDELQGAAGRKFQFPVHRIELSSGRRLRIGYVSADFRAGSVSRFFVPLLQRHDKHEFEVFCYDVSHLDGDGTTLKLQHLAEHWRKVGHLSDYDAAAQINKDQIDVLVDLGGHTKNNRPSIFTYKPAPLQVSYLGYFASTGLSAIDYWISDEYLHPDNSAEPATEKIYRLPRCAFSFWHEDNMPAVSSCPSANDQVVFGSFHELSKLSELTISAWAQILVALPGSSLLVMQKLLEDASIADRLLREFERHGVGPERLRLEAGLPYLEYLERYASVDIALDPFPRTGGTTTAEALWMGVPVVTLAGDRYVERISGSKLHALELKELIASSRSEFIEKAIALARNPSRRQELRENLRSMIMASALGDGAGLARSMELAYVEMIRAAA